MATLTIHIVRIGLDEMLALWQSLRFDAMQLLFCVLLTVFVGTLYFVRRPRQVFLIDYACFKPPVTYRVPFSTFMEHANLLEHFDSKSVDFQMKILERSGLGEDTCLLAALHYLPPKPHMVDARNEAELIIFSCLDDLFKKADIRPMDVDIPVVNCSLFSPTPSLSAMIINKYKMRSNIHSFNLFGMGCSVGLISVDLARDTLQVHPNSYAVVVSTEIISPNWYARNERSMLLPNCLFCMGDATILLSNRWWERRQAKYWLVHVVRTHKGAKDRAFKCIYEEEDRAGNVGLNLSKDLMVIASEGLTSNVTTMGPLVLSASEQLLFVLFVIGRKILNHCWQPYIPNFKQSFEHFCIHAGGCAVIDKLEKNLQLSAQHVEASRMMLHRISNTSSSSLWYELCYIESKGGMKKGDHVWQIVFGSRFKCNSAVWRCNCTIMVPVDGPWSDCIQKYPFHILDVVKL